MLTLMNDLCEALDQFCLLMFLLTINFAGGFGVLVVLHYMEYTNPAYVIFTTAVFGYVSIMTIVVAVNRA